MSGDVLGVLNRPQGETLDAPQYPDQPSGEQGRDEYIRVTLDSEHYRAKREEALRKLAARMAAAPQDRPPRRAGAMNPYGAPRAALRAAGQPLRHHPLEGEEPYRRVIITLK